MTLPPPAAALAAALADRYRIERELGDALGYAHQRGIVHRDVKPENILLEGGHAVVADFGIARVVSAAGAAGGEHITQTGMTLGTPLYMSPEQAAGDADLDGRSDLYSLGCVLYEMLGGQAPFTGPTVESIVRQHMLTDAPPITNIRPTVPAAVARALARSLAKNPADRTATAAQFVQTLTTGGAATVQPTVAAWSAAHSGARRWRSWTATTVGLLAVGLVAAVWMVRRSGSHAPEIALGRSDQLTADPGLEIQPALSPDGKFVAYAQGTPSQMRIYIRPLGGGRTIPLSDDSSAVETHPLWSPDGRALLFWDQIALAPASIAHRGPDGAWGTPRQLVAPALFPVWAPDGREIAYSTQPPARKPELMAIAVGGGTPRLVARLDDPAWQSIRPFFATDGKRLFFPVEDRQSDIYVAEVTR